MSMENQQQRQIQPASVPRLARPPQQADMLTPKDIWLVIRRHIWLIIIITFIGFIGGGTSWYLLRRYAPQYTAATFIRVLPPVETDPMKIGSPVVAKDIQYGRRVYIASLIKQQSMLMDLLGRDKVKQTEWFKSFGSEQNKARRIREALEDLEDNFHASASRDAEFVRVSMTCGDAQESADIVNEMVDLFIASQRDTAVSGVRNKLVELEQRRASLESKLDLAEKSLDDVRKATGLTDLEEHQFQHTITLRLNTLDQEVEDLRLTVSQLQANIQNLEEIAQGPIAEQVENTIERDPTMVMLTQQLFSAKTALAQLQTRFGENHRTVREYKKRIADLQERRNVRKQEIGEQTRKANLEDAKDQLVVLTRRLEEAQRQKQEAEAEKRRLDLAKVQYEQRVRIRDQLEEQLNEIKNLIEQRRIQAEDPETPKVMRVGPAPKPLQVSSPLWYVYFPGGTMLGMAAAIGLTFLLELLNDLLRTPRDVTRYIDVPLLGVIPDADEDRELGNVDLYHIVRLAPHSILTEAYRQLQINLKLSNAPNRDKVIFISSCGAGDGKTSVAVNLAASLVQESKRVLLIDANFWRPMLHKVFPQDGFDKKQDVKTRSEIGLSNLLSGRAETDRVIRTTEVMGLDVLDAGPAPTNPTELISSENMTRLITNVREQFDHIIIDGPPVLLVSSAKVLACFADGTIMAFNADFTKRGAAQRAIRELRSVNASILGCVLVGAHALKGGYFQQQYRSYQRYQQPLLAG